MGKIGISRNKSTMVLDVLMQGLFVLDAYIHMCTLTCARELQECVWTTERNGRNLPERQARKCIYARMHTHLYSRKHTAFTQDEYEATRVLTYTKCQSLNRMQMENIHICIFWCAKMYRHAHGTVIYSKSHMAYNKKTCNLKQKVCIQHENCKKIYPRTGMHHNEDWGMSACKITLKWPKLQNPADPAISLLHDAARYSHQRTNIYSSNLQDRQYALPSVGFCLRLGISWSAAMSA